MVPLIYIDGLLFPYMTPKTIFFRGVAIVAVIVFAYLALVAKKEFHFDRLKSKLTWQPAMLLIFAYVSSILNGGFFHGFWSSFGRGDGLLTLSLSVLLFYIAILAFDKKSFERLIKAVSVVGSLVALYAVLQWIQTKTGLNIPIIEDMDGRIGGTLNNAAFLSSYLSMTFFLTLYAIKDLKGKWLYFGWAFSALQIVAILLSATRSSILGMIIALGIFIVYQSIWGIRNAKKLSRIAVLICIILSILFFVFRAELKYSNIEPVRRIASIGTQDGTVSSRLFVWKSIFPEAMKKPVLGYGAENIEDVFNYVYNPKAIAEQWFDRSHNSFLDYFVQYGLIGLVLYVSLIVSLLYYAIKNWKAGNKYGPYIFFAGILYAVNNFFVFDTVVTLWLFLMLLAFVIYSNKEDAKPFGIKNILYPKYIGYVIMVALVISLVPVVYSPLVSNRLMAKGYKYQISDVGLSSEYLKKGYDMGTYADIEYGHQVYLMYTENQKNLLKGDDLKKAFETAVYILSENFKKYPDDARTGIYLAHVLNLAPEGVVIDDETVLNLLEKVSKLSPKRSELWYIKANIDIRKGNTFLDEKEIYYRKAIATFEDFIKNIGEDSRTSFVLAGLYKSLGENEQAMMWAERGKSVYKENRTTASHAVSFYISISDWKNALFFMKDIVKNNKADLNSKYELAKLYYLNDEREEAVRIYKEVLSVDPNLATSDKAFLDAINAEINK